MSVRAMTWAFDQPIQPTEKIVLLSMADHADEKGVCWPSIALLVRRANVSERTVQRAIQSLEGAGYISRERRTRENGSDTSNLYRLMMLKGAESVSGDIRDDQRVSGGVKLTPRGEGVTDDGGEGVMGVTPGGVTGVTPRTTIKNPQKEPPSLSSEAEADLEAEFEEFWSVYPKRPNNPRKPAMAAFKKARRNVSQKHLLTAVTKYAAYMAGENPKYIAMAATWLNGERWTCDYEKAADVISAHKEIVKGGIPTPIDMALVTKLVSAYPARENINLDAVIDAIVRQRAGDELPEIITAAEKYALLVKQRRDDGLEPEVPPLDRFIKFRWREMNAYEFCRTGMLNKLAVRPKRVSA